MTLRKRQPGLLTWMIFLCLLPTLKIAAQADFAAGYIITANEDTTFGFIDQKNFKTNSKECLFRPNPDAKTVKYTPNDIKSYHFTNGKAYVSKKIAQNGDSTRVFLEYMVDGIADLFFLRDKTDRYFIEKPGKGLQELEVEEKQITMKTDNGSEYQKLKVIDKYKGILKYTFADDQQLYRQIDNTSFGARDLVNITKAYHNDVCNDYACIDYTKDLRTRIKLTPVAGVIVSWMTLKSSEGYTRNIRPVAGVLFNFNPSYLSEKWDLTTGLTASGNHFDGMYDSRLFSRYDYDIRTYHIDVRYYALRIPLMVGYTLPGEKLQSKISLGVNNVLLPGKEYAAFKYTTDYYELPVDTRMTAYHFGLTAGTELIYHLNEKADVQMSIFYERRTPASNFRHLMDYQLIHSLTVTFGASVKLTKN